jgi:hypothetical protein
VYRNWLRLKFPKIVIRKLSGKKLKSSLVELKVVLDPFRLKIIGGSGAQQQILLELRFRENS